MGDLVTLDRCVSLFLEENKRPKEKVKTVAKNVIGDPTILASAYDQKQQYEKNLFKGRYRPKNREKGCFCDIFQGKRSKILNWCFNYPI